MKVKGKNVIVYVYRSGSPVLAVCATNISRSDRSGMISTLTRGSGKERTYKGTFREGTVTLDGVRTLDQTSAWQADDWEVGVIERLIIIYEDEAGNSVSYDANVLVTDVSDSNEASAWSTYSVVMQRSGAWTKLYDVVVGDEHYLVDGNGDFILDSNGDYIIVP
jgi:hypothetical protein